MGGGWHLKICCAPREYLVASPLVKILYTPLYQTNLMTFTDIQFNSFLHAYSLEIVSPMKFTYIGIYLSLNIYICNSHFQQKSLKDFFQVVMSFLYYDPISQLFFSYDSIRAVCANHRQPRLAWWTVSRHFFVVRGRSWVLLFVQEILTHFK